ncbi:MAG: phospholipase D-like domain-containing protein [Nanoarchaeota archaeon]
MISVYFCPQDRCMDKIIEYIDNSTDIKCAFYELNLAELIDELREKNAKVMIENDNVLDYFETGYSYALMHNKFCVFDNKTVMTGSMNPTERENYYNNNNLVFIESEHLAKNYLDEFKELENKKYGVGNIVSYPVVFLGDIKIENYFCPEDNCKLHVINALKEANSSIYFMTFSFTDEDIGNLLWNKNFQGLDVKGIIETKQAGGSSRYGDLKEFAILDKNPYTMHHKVFIIDNKTVITGSYNPTQNANENNDENILIIHDKATAEKFISEFERVYNFEESFPNKIGDLILHRIMYDAEGSDEGKEYIEIKNIGNKTIDLGYYFLSNNITNYRLSGILEINETSKIKPTFSLRNSNGILMLKKNQEIIDFVAWEGLWKLEAKEGKYLERINHFIDEKSWVVK